MKQLTLLTLLHLCFTSFGQDATKEETVNWLKSRLDYNKQWNEKTYEKLEIVRYDYKNDTLYYKVQYTWSKDEGGYRIESIPMRDINANRMSIVRKIGDEGDLAIELYTNYGKESIREYIKGWATDKGMYLNRDNTEICFPKALLDSEGYDLPERVLKALKHLTEKAGSKGEKF